MKVYLEVYITFEMKYKIFIIKSNFKSIHDARFKLNLVVFQLLKL